MLETKCERCGKDTNNDDFAEHAYIGGRVFFLCGACTDALKLLYANLRREGYSRAKAWLRELSEGVENAKNT